MINYEEVLKIAPFSLAKEKKEELLTYRLKQLTISHYQNCPEYKRMLDAIGFNPEKISSYYDIPFLPVSLFKELDLLSVDKSDVFKTMTSSGTTGQAVSRIYLDKTTASNQQKTLVKIVSDILGTSRMPMLIIDSPLLSATVRCFCARRGILGFSTWHR